MVQNYCETLMAVDENVGVLLDYLRSDDLQNDPNETTNLMEANYWKLYELNS